MWAYDPSGQLWRPGIRVGVQPGSRFHTEEFFGPVLGIMQGVHFARTHGMLAMGDALMIYSDGIIESRGHDLSEGTDRMLGAASGAMVRQDVSVADAVMASARSGESDDRAVFVIVRR